jgi:5-methylcytosine-specific restriction endonuclease McrA
MGRCYSQYGLEVHPIRQDGGDGLDNAEVLCARCHLAASTSGDPGGRPPDLEEATRTVARLLAGNKCQCTRATCGFH